MKRSKYYTPRDVALHYTREDLWVTLNGKVLDITPLVKDKGEDEILPLMAFAGKDISHLFDGNDEVKLHVDPATNKISPFCPFTTLLGSPSQKEAEEMYLKRKQLDEEATSAFMQRYISARLVDPQMQSVPEEKPLLMHAITSRERSFEVIQRVSSSENKQSPIASSLPSSSVEKQVHDGKLSESGPKGAPAEQRGPEMDQPIESLEEQQQSETNLEGVSEDLNPVTDHASSDEQQQHSETDLKDNPVEDLNPKKDHSRKSSEEQQHPGTEQIEVFGEEQSLELNHARESSEGQQHPETDLGVSGEELSPKMNHAQESSEGQQYPETDLKGVFGEEQSPEINHTKKSSEEQLYTETDHPKESDQQRDVLRDIDDSQIQSSGTLKSSMSCLPTSLEENQMLETESLTEKENSSPDYSREDMEDFLDAGSLEDSSSSRSKKKIIPDDSLSKDPTDFYEVEVTSTSESFPEHEIPVEEALENVSNYDSSKEENRSSESLPDTGHADNPATEEINSKKEQNGSNAGKTQSETERAAEESSENSFDCSSSKEMNESHTATPVDDLETSQLEELNSTGTNPSSSSNKELSEDLPSASTSREKGLLDESSETTSTINENDTDNPSSIEEKQSKMSEANSVGEDSSKDILPNSSEEILYHSEDSTTEDQDPDEDSLDENKEDQNSTDSSLSMEVKSIPDDPNDDIPQITSTTDIYDESNAVIPKLSAETEETSSKEQEIEPDADISTAVPSACLSPSFSGEKVDASTDSIPESRFEDQDPGQISSAIPSKEGAIHKNSSSEEAWWKDPQYVVGLLTKKARFVKIFNTMIMQGVKLEVCSEETIEDIMERYLKFNSNADNYTWKYLEYPLNMRFTLEENGILDRDELASRLRLDPDDFVPTLILYYNDLQ